MTATSDQFRDILETEENVHMGNLIDIARHGIPSKVRGEVWKYLLGISKPDKAEEAKRERQQTQDYNNIDKSCSTEIVKSIKNQITRTYSKYEFFQQPSVQNRIVEIISAYTNYAHDVEYNSSMISLIGPLVYSLKKDSEIFWCFEALMKKIEQHFSEDSLPDKMSRLMMYIRFVHSELANHFEEEELSLNDWSMSWLKYLFSRELPLECVLRLWDTYFSDGFDLHIYVCIAILVNCAEELQELEISELKGLLQHLPVMDMDLVS
eukprot:TRINITY_DN5323_c0_g1_i3.p1 TRINITY_DN5323_c0_g1~~TRINITY_DN5323_c0_g1_i3.p1  ORF type:complete len:265 (-),score=45.94 TRINITY_DN5323_c0_g1_i3:380-1174(-)